MSASQGVTIICRGGSDEAAWLFPQQRGISGQDRAQSQGALSLSTCRTISARASNARPAYLAINPQGLVPALEDDAGAVLTQSLAIIEWLDETHPEPPLLPKDPLRRAKARAFAHGARLRHPPGAEFESLNRLRQLGVAEEKVTEWAAWANREGLAACETLIAREPGPFCFGDKPTMADLCLVPQLANARRFGVDVSAYPRLLKAEAAAKEMKAFADAAPDKQPDAE